MSNSTDPIIRVDHVQEVNRYHQNIDTYIALGFPESEALQTVAKAQYLDAVMRLQGALSWMVELQCSILSRADEVDTELTAQREVAQMLHGLGIDTVDTLGR